MLSSISTRQSRPRHSCVTYSQQMRLWNSLVVLRLLACYLTKLHILTLPTKPVSHPPLLLVLPNGFVGQLVVIALCFANYLQLCIITILSPNFEKDCL